MYIKFTGSQSERRLVSLHRRLAHHSEEVSATCEPAVIAGDCCIINSAVFLWQIPTLQHHFHASQLWAAERAAARAGQTDLWAGRGDHRAPGRAGGNSHLIGPGLPHCVNIFTTTSMPEMKAFWSLFHAIAGQRNETSTGKKKAGVSRWEILKKGVFQILVYTAHYPHVPPYAY